MNTNTKMFHIEVGSNFLKDLEDLSKLNKDCFDGLFDLGYKETLALYGVDDEKQIPEDKRKEFAMAVDDNRYIKLHTRIFLLVDCGLSMFGKFSKLSRYGTLFCNKE